MSVKSKIMLVSMYLCVAVTGCSSPTSNDAYEWTTELNEQTSEQTGTSEVVLRSELSEASSESELSEPSLETKQDLMFEPTSDLMVSLAYTYDNNVFIVVENTCDRAILDYKIAYTEFDGNGFSVTTETYRTGIVNAANLISGEKKISSFYDSDGKYVAATVVYIKYQGDEEWQAENIDLWADNVIDNFSVDNHKNGMEILQEKAVLAEKNDYLQIVSTNKKHTNQFSNKDDFQFTLSNNSENTIETVKICILEFDENGLAVSTSPYDRFAKNDRAVGGTINLVAGSTNTFYSDLFFEPECSNYKCVVQEIVFADGTEWHNPYIYEWIFCNKNQYE